MAESGASTSSTLSYLKANTGNEWSTRKEINNQKLVSRKNFLAGRTPIQALYKLISSGSYIFDMKTDGNGSLSGLFFSHKSAEKLCKTFKSVFVMDCTYKTNRFGMPLLNIVGITSTFHSFNAGFAFICEETELEYTWALKAFSNVVVVLSQIVRNHL